MKKGLKLMAGVLAAASVFAFGFAGAACKEEKTENNVFESLSQAFSVIALAGILVYIIFSDAKNALPVLKLTSFGGAGVAFIGAIFGKIKNDDDSDFFHNIVEVLICIALIFKTLINFSE